MLRHQLKPKTVQKGKRRVGRGGKRGTYSGHGIKGQKSRAGRKMRPELRDIIKKIPKLRGHHKHKLRSIQAKVAAVNLSTLDAKFIAGETVSLETLRTKGVVRSGVRAAKVLGTGEITKKLVVLGLPVSATARVKIEKAGGSVDEGKNETKSK